MSKQRDIVKVSQDAGTTGFVNTTGDTMTGTLDVPNFQIDGVEQLSFAKKGDLPNVGGDFDDQSYRNSVFYSLNPANAPHSNNGVAAYISTYGAGGTHDDATNERAAQLYFGDTAGSGFHYRVKQGTGNWHPWVSLSVGMKGVHFASTNAQTFVNNTTGITILETTFSRLLPSMYGTSKFLVIATVNGAAEDDASAVIEFYDGATWTQPDALIGAGGVTGFRGSFGDFSVVRSSISGMENKQTLQFTACFVHAPASTAGTLGYRVRCTAENSNGFWLNRPVGTDSGYNTNSSRSTLLIIELTGNV